MRVTVTTMSSNSCLIGASGLCTRTVARARGKRASSASAITRREPLDEVEPLTRRDLDHDVGDLAVADGVREPVGLAARARARHEHEVDHEALAVLLLVVAHAVVGVHRRPSTSIASSVIRHLEGAHDRERVHRLGDVVHPQEARPGADASSGRGDRRGDALLRRLRDA